MPRRVTIPAALVAIVAVGASLALAGPASPFHGRGGPLAPAGGGTSGGPVPAGEPAAQAGAPGRPVVSVAGRHDTSKPLRSISPKAAAPGEEDADTEVPLPLPGRAGGAKPPPADDPVVQAAPLASAAAASVTTNFEGVSNINSVAPPDPNGDIGPNNYVQWVNLSFAIYDRSGTRLYGPAAGNTLFAGFGGPCESTNDGDPIAQYDHLANRWVMSQFALPNYNPPNNIAGPFYECIAVSTTGDPTGSWYRYEFKISDTKLDDYPHLGIWPDAYYMSINQFNEPAGSWGGAGAVAFERAKMLQGQAARLIYVDLFGVDPNLGGMLPSDLDGPAPPNGAPNVYAEADDDGNGYAQDQLDLWDFHVDWTNTANSTFSHDAALATAAMDTNLCGYSRDCIPQPPFTVQHKQMTQGLDALSDRIMYRLQYRNFGAYQTLVTTQTVDTNGLDHAGIRWFEVRNSGAGWAIRQQGTWAPDGASRWLASAAMDGAGDIALGYSVSSSTVSPSIRFAGRQAGDPLGTLGIAESTIMAGSGTQTTTVARWGDYSMLAVDPTDDCTFWYTNEYIATTSNAAWRTRVAAVQLPGCGGGGDLTPPAVTSFGPTTPSPTNAATINYGLSFSEPVTGLAAADFSRTGTATGCTVGAPSGSGASYTIAVTGCSEGTVILGLNASTVMDASSNAGPTSPSTASTVAIDRTAPTATLTPPASPTNASTLAFGVGFSQAVTGLAAGDFSVGGTATGCVAGSPSGSGSSYTVNLSGCSAGTVVLTLKMGSVADAASNAGPAADVTAGSVLVDRTAPTVAAPIAGIRSGVQINGGTLAIRVVWSGSDAGGAGIATYDVAQSLDGGAFATVATALASPALNIGASSVHTYRFEVRARDRAGNVGGWLAGPTMTPSLVQNTSAAIAYHGTWTTSSSASYSAGSVRYATAAGAYATYTFSGRSVGFVTTLAPTRGAVNVYIDGVLAATVSCYAPSTTYRWVAYSRTWAGVGTHTIKLVVVGTAGHPRIDLDAIEVLK